MAWPVLIVMGTILVGIGLTNQGNSYGEYGGMWEAGVAFLAIGVAVKIAFWSLMIVRHRQRRRCPAPPPIEQPLSKWWLIGLFIPCFILIITGVTLVVLGLEVFETDTYHYSSTAVSSGGSFTDDEGGYEMTSAGIACLAIGLTLGMAFWAAVFVRTRQRRRARLAVPPTYPYGRTAPAMPAPVFQMAPALLNPATYTTQQQPSLSIAEVSGQHLKSSPAEVSGQHLIPSPAEVSGQQRIPELSPTPTSTATAELSPQQRHATATPSSIAAELPTSELPLKPVAAPPPPHAPPQVFSNQKEVAPSAEKELTARFCKYCGGPLDAATQRCGSCGV